MSTLQMCGLLLVPVVVAGAGGCSIFSKSAPSAPRYFSPERPNDGPRSACLRPAAPTAELRLGRVESAANLEQMLVFRDSASEVGYYRLRRWTEAPKQYLKRRLVRVLFEECGLRGLVGGGSATLDVQLTAFEEIRVPRRIARVQVIVRLHDERRVSWEETLTVEGPVAEGGDPAEAAVQAIGKALRAVVDRIADRVLLELAVAPAGDALKH